jgi:hypothetical protein
MRGTTNHHISPLHLLLLRVTARYHLYVHSYVRLRTYNGIPKPFVVLIRVYAETYKRLASLHIPTLQHKLGEPACYKGAPIYLSLFTDPQPYSLFSCSFGNSNSNIITESRRCPFEYSHTQELNCS